MTDEQLDRALGRMLEDGGIRVDEAPVQAALAELERRGDRKAARDWRKWYDPEVSEREQRREARARNGTRAQQQSAYQAWVQEQIARFESAEGTGAVSKSVSGERSRLRTGRTAASLEELWTSNPATIRANASEELLRWFADNPPLPFDAWRASHLQATDKRATDALKRRRAQWLSEFG